MKQGKVGKGFYEQTMMARRHVMEKVQQIVEGDLKVSRAALVNSLLLIYMTSEKAIHEMIDFHIHEGTIEDKDGILMKA